MRLSNKHANAQIVSYSDFSGGLNTSNAAEMIQPNELAKCINLEADKSTGLLRTVAGTNPVYINENMTFDYLMYDSIGDNILLTDSDRNIYKLVVAAENKSVWDLEKAGTLEGTGDVSYVAWEDGIVIAGGGRLQYFHNDTLETIDDPGAPTECYSPHVQNGRIFVGMKDELHYSGVGDEHKWTVDTNDDSGGQWLQIGYKDGGIITGISSLASDVIVFKSNRRAYHLAGAYPNWAVTEIGRNVDCKGFNDCVALSNSVVVLGNNTVQAVTVNDRYGDMAANDISLKVKNDIQKIGNARIRYIPSLNQVWFLSGLPMFLFLDGNNSGYFYRQYHSPVVDTVEADHKIYMLKEHGLYVCTDDSFHDESEPMMWKLQGKTMTSANSLLVKREWVDSTPYFQNYAENTYRIDKAVIYGAVPKEAMCVYHDYSRVYRSLRPIYNVDYTPIFSDSDEVYSNPDYIFGNDTFLKSLSMYRSIMRQLSRNRAIKVQGYGAGGRLLINSINFEIVEV